MRLAIVLEYDRAVQKVLRAMLERDGFTVEVTATADEALVLCRQRRTPVRLLIAEVHLPSRSGAAAAAEIRQYCPNLPILFTSGTPPEFWNVADRLVVERICRNSSCFLQKPFTCWTLAEKIDGLLPWLHLARTA